MLRLILVMMLGICLFGCGVIGDDDVRTVEDEDIEMVVDDGSGIVVDDGSGAVILSIDPSSGRLENGQAAERVTIVFSKPPKELWVSGTQEWSLQRETLTLLTEYCEHRGDSLKVKIGWANGGKTLNYRCP